MSFATNLHNFSGGPLTLTLSQTLFIQKQNGGMGLTPTEINTHTYRVGFFSLSKCDHVQMLAFLSVSRITEKSEEVCSFVAV